MLPEFGRMLDYLERVVALLLLEDLTGGIGEHLQLDLDVNLFEGLHGIVGHIYRQEGDM